MRTFLGRERELRFLHDSLGDVLNGESRIIHIKGAKGLGKTSLIKKFFSQLPENLFSIHSSHVHPGYGIMKEFVKKYGSRRRLLGRVVPFEAVKLYPFLENYIPVPEFMDGRIDEYSILYSFLDRMSDISPLVIALDNVEHYSRDDIELLKKLMLSLEGKPILFILVSTPEISFYKAITLELSPLTFEELSSLNLPMESIEKLLDITGGIPTIVDQILFLMDYWKMDLSEVISGEMLGEIYAKILDAITDSQREYLRKVALTDYVDTRAEEFHALKNMGLVDEDGIRLHGLKDFILEQIPGEERLSFYRREALRLLKEVISTKDIEKYHELVRYLELSELDSAYPEMYSSYSLEIAEHYRSLYKYHLALEYYDKVKVEPYRKQAIKGKLIISIKTGGHSDVERLFEEVRDDPEAIENYAKYLLFMRKFDKYRELIGANENPILELYYLYYSRHFDEFKNRAEKLLDDIEGSDRLNILNFLATVYWLEGDREKAVEFFDGLKDEATRLGDLVIAGKAYYHMAVIAYEMGNYSVALQYASRALDLSRKGGYIYGQMLSHYFLGVFLQEMGDYERSRYHLERARELSIVEKNDYIRLSTTFRLSDDDARERMVKDILKNRKDYDRIFNRLALDVLVPYLARKNPARAKEILSDIEPESDFMDKIYRAYRAFLSRKKLPRDIPPLLRAQIYELKESTLKKALEIYRDLGFNLKVREIMEKLEISSGEQESGFYIRTFGGLSILDPSGRVYSSRSFGTYKSLQILLLLIKSLWDERQLTLDDIISMIWPEFDTQRAVNNFHVNLASIRKILGKNAIVKDNNFYRLNTEVVNIDLLDFKRNFEEGMKYRNAGNPHKAFQYFEKAIEIAKGTFLKGIYDPLFDDFIIQVNSAIVDALEFIGYYELERGNYEKAYRISKDILALDYLNERGHEIAIRSLMLMGRRKQALDYMSRVMEVFKEELGVVPDFLIPEKGGAV